MRTQTCVFLCGLLLSVWGSVAAAGDVYVVCHPSVNLKADEIRDVYFGDKGFAGSVKLLPAENSALQAEFLEKVVKLDAKKYSSIWVKKAFQSGSVPPPTKASDAEALAYVKQTAGACSYVSSSPGDGVVVVGKF